MRKAREALRFASIAPHNLPCRERFAGRFSEASCYGQSRFKTLFLYTLLALPASAARNAEQGTHVQGNTGVLAELFKYINQERKASTGGLRKCNKAAGYTAKINFFPAD